MNLAIYIFLLHISLTPQPKMSRVELAQHLDFGLTHISQITGFSKGFLWSYYITETGGKSKALVIGFNYGGLQVKGKTLYFDSPIQGAMAWVRCLLLSRYDDCRSLSAMERQQCMKDKGYHGSSCEYRYQIEKQYQRMKLEEIKALPIHKGNDEYHLLQSNWHRWAKRIVKAMFPIRGLDRFWKSVRLGKLPKGKYNFYIDVVLHEGPFGKKVVGRIEGKPMPNNRIVLSIKKYSK